MLEANETSKNLVKTVDDSNRELSSNIKQEELETERRDRNKEKNIRLTKEVYFFKQGKTLFKFLCLERTNR